MFNCKIEFNNTNANVNFPCTNNILYSVFAEMHVPDEIKSKIDIQIVGIDYEPLKCLEGKSYDPDAINLLAQKLDSFTENEIRKFEAIRELNGITDIYNMINLTENMHYYTLVTDMSDIKAVGKLHIMTRDGGIAADKTDSIDFETVGKNLVESGNGRITKYGNIYTNSDLAYYKPCTRESLPQFQYYDQHLVCVEMSYQGNKNYVYLPDTMKVLERAACRMGASGVSKCECKIDYTNFNFKQPDEPNSVKMNSDKLHDILVAICENEGVDKLNMTAQELGRLDGTYITHIVPVIEYAEDSSSDTIAKLVENIESFAVYGDVSCAYDLGVALINDNPHYTLNPDIEDYFNFEKYGDDMDLKWNGEYLEGDIYVGIKEGITLEEILQGDEVKEEQGMQMPGM